MAATLKKLLAVSAGFAMLPLGSFAVADQLQEELSAKTVMITVNFKRGKASEYGSGVVFCQDDERAWILTANHVFAGKSTEPWKQVRLRQIERTRIEFYRNAVPAIEADTTALRKQFKFYTFKPEDVLLFSVPLAQRLPAIATPSSPPSEAEEQKVSAVGFWKDRGLTWAGADGELSPGVTDSSKFLFHTAEVHEGFSGGPLFTAQGELIGINLQRVPGEQTPDGKAGQWYGKAQLLNNTDVLSVIDKWVPAKCLENASQLTELAFFIYKKAMRQVSIQRWDEAEVLLRQSIAQKSVEGGSVHLEGMRYTKYLPHYHLGLALLKLGRYSDAIREFDRSEAQGVIHDDKRYSKLKSYREDAYESLGEQTAQATPEKPLPPPKPRNPTESVTADSTAAVVTPVAVTTATPKVAAVDPPPPGEVIQGPRDAEWLRRQKANQFVIQLVAASDEERIQNFIDQHALKDEVAVFTTERDGQTWHVVVYGLYGEADAARASITQMPEQLRNGSPWIRSIASVQRSLRSK